MRLGDKMNKTAEIEKLLKQNNHEKLQALIEHQLTQTSLAKQFNVSKTVVKNAILKVEPDFTQKSRQYVINQLKIIQHFLMKGVLMDVLIESGYTEVLSKKPSTDMNNLVRTKMFQYGLHEEVSSKALITYKLLSMMVRSAKIEKMYKQGFSKQDVVNKLHLKLHHVSPVYRNILFFGTPLPYEDPQLFEEVKRNMAIYDTYLKHHNMTYVYKTHRHEVANKEELDLRVKTMIKFYEKDDNNGNI